MLKALCLALAFNLLVTGVAVSGPTLHLRWNDCPAGLTSTPLMSFGCNDDTTAFRLIGSIVPDAPIAHVIEIIAAIDFMSCGTSPLPDWWQMGGALCRDASLTIHPRPSTASGCAPMWPGYAATAMSQTYSKGPTSVGVALSLAVPVPNAVNLNATREYDLFELVIDSQHTTDADPPVCGGCAIPGCLAFWSVQFFDGSNSVEQRSQTATASWQCNTIAVVDTGCCTPRAHLSGGLLSCTLGECPTPTQRASWGLIRGLYR